MTQPDWKKYLYAFLITAAIFATALYVGNLFTGKKIDELRATESRIALDILSSETQFALLGELSCPEAENSLLSHELNSLGEKLSYSEEQFGADDPDVRNIKKHYSLLEIKDYLLMKKLRDCPKPPVTILYFYGRNCPDCDREGYVLTYLRQTYPELRVYSFDVGLDLSALRTLAEIYGVTAERLPSLVIKRKRHDGFKTVEDALALLPELQTETATTTIHNEKDK